MRRWLPIAIGLVLVLSGGVWASPDAFERLDAASYQLFAREMGSLTAICSAGAFWTNGRLTRLLTAGHCVADDTVRYALTRDGLNFREARILLRGWKKTGADESWRRLVRGLPNIHAAQTYQGHDVSGGDWALLEIDGAATVIPLGTSKSLRMGEDILAIGFPIGGDKIATKGIIANPRYGVPGLPWDNYIAANIPALPGNSGTAVVNPGGEIVAILVAGAGENLHLLTPIDLVKEKAKCLTDEICPGRPKQ